MEVMFKCTNRTLGDTMSMNKDTLISQNPQGGDLLLTSQYIQDNIHQTV